MRQGPIMCASDASMIALGVTPPAGTVSPIDPGLDQLTRCLRPAIATGVTGSVYSVCLTKPRSRLAREHIPTLARGGWGVGGLFVVGGVGVA